MNDTDSEQRHAHGVERSEQFQRKHSLELFKCGVHHF
jgi:hypothetical protein